MTPCPPLQEHTKKLQATNEWREAKRKEERKKRCGNVAANLAVLHALLQPLVCIRNTEN